MISQLPRPGPAQPRNIVWRPGPVELIVRNIGDNQDNAQIRGAVKMRPDITGTARR